MRSSNRHELMKSIKEYWILNGVSCTFELKEEIKNWKGYWVPEHKCWAITNPDENAKRVLKSIGLKLQFRRYL